MIILHESYVETNELPNLSLVTIKMDDQDKSERLHRLRRTFHYDEFLQSIEPDEVFKVGILGGMNALHLFLFGLSIPTDPKEDTIARTKVIKKLIEMKSDINAVDDYGATPLWNAVSCYDVNIIPFLLEQGADVRKNPPHSLELCLFACHKEVKIPSCPIIKQFMLHGIKLDELYSKNGEIEPTKQMVNFYEKILRVRKVLSVFIGLKSKSSLLKLIGRDCLILIARTIYQTRGQSIWDKVM